MDPRILIAIVALIIICVALFFIWKISATPSTPSYQPVSYYQNPPPIYSTPSASAPLPSISTPPSTSNQLPSTGTTPATGSTTSSTPATNTGIVPPAINSVFVLPTNTGLPISNAGKTGVWYKSPGAGYTNGLGAVDSINLCFRNGKAAIAKLSQIQQAAQNGLRPCYAGWYVDSATNKFANGWYGTGQSGCGSTDLNYGTSQDYLNAANKSGVFCYGIIPNTNDVSMSVVL